jgi:hypothetical protein
MMGEFSFEMAGMAAVDTDVLCRRESTSCIGNRGRSIAENAAYSRLAWRSAARLTVWSDMVRFTGSVENSVFGVQRMTRHQNCNGFLTEADGTSMDRLFSRTLNTGMVKEI